MISTETTVERYSGNDSTTTFPFNFKINEEDHLEVIVADENGTETTLVLDTDYSVAGVGEATGSIEYPIAPEASPLPSGHTIALRRKPPFLQETDFENQGGFFAATHENAFDYLTMIVQYLAEELARCPKVSVTSGDEGDTYLETIEAAVVSAQASQTAAETAETNAELAETNAEAARDAALVARDAAIAARLAAEVAETNAETAETNAETAESNAETAQGIAEAAASTATQKASDASGFATAASNSASTASGHATTATNAKNDAVLAQQAAETAQGLAEDAKDAAVIAQGAAEDAQAAAEAAAGSMTLASQAEAEAGTENTKYLSSLRVAQAIRKHKVRTGTVAISAGALAIDASLYDVVNVEVDDDFTLSLPTNGEDGDRIEIRFTQDATGSRVLTLAEGFLIPAELSEDGIVLSTAAGSIDKLGLSYNGTSWMIDAFSTDYAEEA